jgi:hypothetical protein
MTAFPGRVRLSGRDLVFVLEPAGDLLSEIRELGYSGSMNQLYRYITQGRVEAGRPHLSPTSVTRLLLTKPATFSDGQRSPLSELTAAWPPDDQPRRAHPLLRRPAHARPANEAKLNDCAQAARACGLPNIHAFTRAQDLDAL